ncbi:MAG TPA: FAD-dependent oxidoreductase [Candidatus Binatia bacterium]|nr:FAD-dependent oxidoreductase [Candidatus Binatia bacterium]
MRVVVVGAGVMGAWTALWLRRGGHDVTLVDRHGPGNRLGSSGDESRITRSSHGSDRHYPRWQRRGLGHWRALEREAGRQLFVESGVVWLANPAQTFEPESLATLRALGIPAEDWTPDDLARRVPVMHPEGVPWALFEPEAGALLARRGVVAAIERFEAEGGTVLTARVDPPEAADGSTPGDGQLGWVSLADGSTLEADAFVFTAGPWLPDLFPSTIGPLIEPHRQDVMYFQVPPGDTRYVAPAMPAWIDFEGSFYGLPSFDGLTIKACPDWLGPVERCDASARECADETVEASRQVLARRLPGIAAQPVVRTWTCFYEVTPDAHFVIDRHPRLGDVWIAGGGTGHAFKHGPVIGEYLAALVTHDAATASELAPPDDRFAIKPRGARASFRTSGRRPASVALEEARPRNRGPEEPSSAGTEPARRRLSTPGPPASRPTTGSSGS